MVAIFRITFYLFELASKRFMVLFQLPCVAYIGRYGVDLSRGSHKFPPLIHNPDRKSPVWTFYTS